MSINSISSSRVAVQTPAFSPPRQPSSDATAGLVPEGLQGRGSYEIARPQVDLPTAVERLNKAASALSSELRVSIHQATHQIIVRIVDSDGKVLREIPPERVLDAYASMMDSLGLLVDNRA